MAPEPSKGPLAMMNQVGWAVPTTFNEPRPLTHRSLVRSRVRKRVQQHSTSRALPVPSIVEGSGSGHKNLHPQNSVGKPGRSHPELVGGPCPAIMNAIHPASCRAVPE